VKVLVETLGCRANHYDSERVKAMVTASGGEVVSNPELADFAVYNSCAVTADAEADLRQKVRRAARRNPRLRSVIMGCATGFELSRRTEPGEARVSLAALPTVSTLIHGADLGAVARALELSGEADTARQTGARALLRIQDGCDEHCTFCATTIARGASRSRSVEGLLDEAARLGAEHNEIVLTGIHIGSFGIDIGSSLSRLVERLIDRVPRVRFRLSSLEATEVDERLVEIFGGAPRRLAPYLHAPLQSGSDAVLKRMGRSWYTAAAYARAIARIVRTQPDFGLGADVIAGFPGETEDDHRATLRLVESLPFTSLHVFPYSPRPGTAAVKIASAVKPEAAASRARDLRGAAARKADAYRRARNGGRADVVVIRAAANGIIGQGLTGDYLTVAVRDTALARGARFDARLSLEGDAMTATRSDG
jgi:threonylcarbamoyladenosine tRNA methylthiotransferase MtaB